MTELPDPYEPFQLYMTSLGRLCASWAKLDREINFLLAAMLQISKAQMACIATEISDVAPRCRMLKTISHTIPALPTWRATLVELANVIANGIGPARNRYVHDSFGLHEEKIHRMDRRAKLLKPESFADLKLDFDRVTTVDADAVDTVSTRALVAAASIARARLDCDRWKHEGHFPEQPLLSLERVQRIERVRFPLPSGERTPPLEPSP